MSGGAFIPRGYLQVQLHVERVLNIERLAEGTIGVPVEQRDKCAEMSDRVHL